MVSPPMDLLATTSAATASQQMTQASGAVPDADASLCDEMPQLERDSSSVEKGRASGAALAAWDSPDFEDDIKGVRGLQSGLEQEGQASSERTACDSEASEVSSSSSASGDTSSSEPEEGPDCEELRKAFFKKSKKKIKVAKKDQEKKSATASEPSDLAGSSGTQEGEDARGPLRVQDKICRQASAPLWLRKVLAAIEELLLTANCSLDDSIELWAEASSAALTALLSKHSYTLASLLGRPLWPARELTGHETIIKQDVSHIDGPSAGDLTLVLTLRSSSSPSRWPLAPQPLLLQEKEPDQRMIQTRRTASRNVWKQRGSSATPDAVATAASEDCDAFPLAGADCKTGRSSSRGGLTIPGGPPKTRIRLGRRSASGLRSAVDSTRCHWLISPESLLIRTDPGTRRWLERQYLGYAALASAREASTPSSSTESSRPQGASKVDRLWRGWLAHELKPRGWLSSLPEEDVKILPPPFSWEFVSEPDPPSSSRPSSAAIERAILNELAPLDSSESGSS